MYLQGISKALGVPVESLLSAQGDDMRASSEGQLGSGSRAPAGLADPACPRRPGSALMEELQRLKAVTAAPDASSLSKVPLQFHPQSSRQDQTAGIRRGVGLSMPGVL